MTPEQAIELCAELEAAGVRYWVMGGWGVDALLGRETRSHKDLDVLVVLDDLRQLRRMFEQEGFTLSHVWEESRWINDVGERWPTAFVAEDPIGRAIDVHLVQVLADGTVVQHYDNPWSFPQAFAASGTIAGRLLPCVSAAAQIGMHVGYTLPDMQQRDLDLLRGQVPSTGAE